MRALRWLIELKNGGAAADANSMSHSADPTTSPSLPTLPPSGAAFGDHDRPGLSTDALPTLPDAATTTTGTSTTAGQAVPAADTDVADALPRLGEVSTPTSAPIADAPTVDPPLELPTLPTLPTAAPVITGPQGIPAPDAHVVTASDDDADVDTAPANEHPMAHLMPTKTAPSEASQRAADIRAAKKAKAKKIKIGVAVGALVFTAIVGPPLGRWLADAVNEAGNTSTEEPAD